uniref:HTH domain-containing protein n=1 Tax=Streptomyces sp. NBC_00093 TaxID=2975649 RepID=A0AAU1ZZM0_9ACTN
MSAARARRNMRRENVRQLRQREPDLSHRQIAERLGISKDTVRRDLDAIAEEAGADGAAPDASTAPQVSVVGTAGGAPDEPGESRRALPRRMAPLAGAPDLSQWPALRRDLAQMAQSGMSVEALVHQAVVAVAHGYRQALDRGELQPGDRFLVSGVTLRPAALLADRAVPDSAQRP